MSQNFADWIDHDLFKKVGEAADDLNLPCYVVGGWVRDQFLNRGSSKDVDFVVVGDALALAQSAAKLLRAGKVVVYPNFGTYRELPQRVPQADGGSGQP